LFLLANGDGALPALIDADGEDRSKMLGERKRRGEKVDERDGGQSRP